MDGCSCVICVMLRALHFLAPWLWASKDDWIFNISHNALYSELSGTLRHVGIPPKANHSAMFDHMGRVIPLHNKDSPIKVYFGKVRNTSRRLA